MAKKKRKLISKKTQVSENNSAQSIIFRYLVLLIVALPGAWIFYKIFTPLTFYPVYFILGLFYNVSSVSEIAFRINNTVPIELIGACIAGSAYYLLLILNLSIPGIKPLKRVKAILFSFITFLVLNIIRILVLAFLAVSGSSYFDVTHILFWYGLSTIIIVGIWFVEVKIFDIKKIPFYSDLSFLYRFSILNR